KETRNDHQIATATKLAAFGRVNVAMDEQKLFEKLQQLSDIHAAQRIGPHASAELLGTLRQFISGGIRITDSGARIDAGQMTREIETIPQVADAAVFAHG